MSLIRLVAFVLAAGTGFAALPAAAEPPAWQVDYETSRIAFVADWSGSPTRGHFASWHAEIRFAPDELAASHARVEVDLDSVRTSYAESEAQLRAEPWFHVAKHKTALFETSTFRRLGEAGRYEVDAVLTLKGESQEVTLPFTLEMTQSEEGKAQARMSGELTLDRTAFNVGSGQWELADPVGHKVDVKVEVTAIRSN